MKKIFTLKRVALLMSLVFVYSFAFMFVKIYAEKSILSDAMPSDSSLVDAPGEETGESESTNENPGMFPQRAVMMTGAETENTPAVTESAAKPVEYIVNKLNAGQYPMLAAAATSIPDEIEISAEPESEKTTAPTTTETPTTTSKKKETTAAPETEAPAPASTEQPAEDIDDFDSTEAADEEDVIDDEPEEEVDEEDEQREYIEEPEEGYFYEDLTEDELDSLLQTLGVSSLDELVSGGNASAPQSNPNDRLYSGDSYKNQTVTIYDTKQKRVRTDNAFELVCEITNYEVGDSFEREAIKAQAVAIYTYIKYYEQKGEYAELGTKADYSDKIRECVEEIDGLAMFYDGKYIMAPFSASTGGYTAASKNVWGGDLPYLQSVPNEYDYLDSKHYGKVTTYTVEEVREKIESKTDIRLSNNYSEWIRILSYNDNIYAGQLSIDGHTEAKINGKTRTITGHIFRTYVLSIRSTAFTVSYSNGVFTFTTYGYGHGVGLSQIGANLYAKYGGYSFDAILHHYFTGVTIE